MRKTKRFCSAVMMLIMMLTMTTFVGVTPPAKAVTVEEDLIIVDTSLANYESGTQRTVTIGGKAYGVVVGTNGFTTIENAIAAAEDGDTILLQAGTYVEELVINKNLTFLGPKAGIDPNVRGTTETADWTLNENRGSDKGEAIIEGTWYIGVDSNKTVYANVTEFTIDGVAFNAGGRLYNNASSASSPATLTANLKNLLILDSTADYGPFYFATKNVHDDTADIKEYTKRYITAENIRVNTLKNGMFYTISAERFTASGIYMSKDCTAPFNFFTAAVDNSISTSAISVTIKDSMFRGKNTRNPGKKYRGVINTTYNTNLSQVPSFAPNGKTKIDISIRGNVFVNNDNANENYNTSLFIASNTTKTYFDIYQNTFINDTDSTTGHTAIVTYFGNAKHFNTAANFYRNRFVNTVMLGEYTASDGTYTLNFNGNYAEKGEDKGVAPTVKMTNNFELKFYYLDWEMTKSSAPVVVNKTWTEENTPATYTFKKGEEDEQVISDLAFGVNAFSEIQDAFDNAGKGNTVILCSGDYGAVYFPYSLTVLGPKAGIDPSVRGENKTGDWTLNPKRSNAAEEANITGLWYVGTDESDAMLQPIYHITVDGMSITGQGAFGNRTNAHATIVNTTFCNIYVNNSKRDSEVFYLHGYSNGADGKTRRNIVFENIRFEGQTAARGVFADAETLYASGIYMDNTSTQCLTNTVGISSGDLYTDPVKWHFTDMNIRTHARQIINFSARTGSTKTNAAIGKKERVDLMVTDSVFFENQDTNSYVNSAAQKNDNIIVPQQNTPNVFFTFTDNYFIGTKELSFATTAISATDSTSNRHEYAANTTVKNNRFYNFTTDVNYANLLSSGEVDISGNYSEGQDGNIRKPIGNEAEAEWWYVDETLTHKSDEIDGELSADAEGEIDPNTKKGILTTATNTVTFSLDSDFGNTLTVYADKELTQALSASAPLFEETQTLYVKVSSMDGSNSEVYTLTVNTTNPNLTEYNLAKDVRFFGRVRTEGDKYLFNWTASGFEFNFNGTGASAEMIALDTTNNDTNDRGEKNAAYVKVYVDGEHTKTIELSNTAETYVLASGLKSGKHTVKVVKRTNARSSGAAVTRITLAEGGKRLEPPKAHTRLIQAIGDSITVGYGSLSEIPTDTWSTATEDGTITYAALAAEALCADYDAFAISGRGILRNNDHSNTKLIPDIYDQMDPYVDASIKHDFDSAKQPDVVIVNLGTNDKNSIGKTGYESKDEWVEAVKAFLKQLRDTHPKAQIIYAYGLMSTELIDEIKQAVTEYSKEESDDAIHFVQLTKMATGEIGADSHPNHISHKKGAAELLAKIKEVTDWEEGHVWSDWETVDEGRLKVRNCTICFEQESRFIPTGTAAANGITLDDGKEIEGTFEDGFTVKIPMGRPRVPQVVLAPSTALENDSSVTQALLPDDADRATATIKLAGGEETTITFVKDPNEGFVLQYGDRYTFAPSTIDAVSFDSSDSDVATVTNDGVITVKSVSKNGVTITATAADGATEKLFITETVRAVLGIWMLTGQSNSEPAYFDLNTTVGPDAGTALYWGRKPKDDGSGLSDNWTTTPEEMTDDDGTANFGALDAPIAKTIYDYTGEKVLMFSVGWSDQSVSAFDPTTNSDTSSDNPYGRSVIQWKSMMDVVNSDAFKANYETRVRSYFWLQGCVDHDMAVATYKDHFTKMHNVYTDQSGIFGFDNCFISKVSWKPTGLAYMSRQAQEELATELDNVYIATRIGQTMSLAEGTYRTDNLHFTQAGKNLMGSQMGAFAARTYMGGEVVNPANSATVFAYQNKYAEGDTLHVFPGQNFTFTLRPDPIISDDQFVVKFTGDDIVDFDEKDWMQISGKAEDGQTAYAEIYSENGTLLWKLPIVVVDNAQTPSTDNKTYKEYRWDFNGTLAPTKGDITLNRVVGSDAVFTENGTALDSAKGTYYSLSHDITLDHTGYWAIEWRAKNMAATNNMLLASHERYKGEGEFFYTYYRSERYWDIYHSTDQHNIYNTSGMDITDWHTYRIELIDNKYVFTIDGVAVFTQAVIDGYDVSGFLDGASKFTNFSNIHYLLGGVNATVGNTATYGYDAVVDYISISVADDLRLTKIKDERVATTGGSGTAEDPFTVSYATACGENFIGTDFSVSGPSEVRMNIYGDTFFGKSVSSVSAPVNVDESNDVYLVFFGSDEVNSVYYKVTLTSKEFDPAAWLDIVTAKIHADAPVKDETDNTFSVLYHCLLNPGEIDFGNTPIRFTQYGIVYATSEQALEQYATSGKFGDEPTISGTKRSIFDQEDVKGKGLSKIYKNYLHELQGTKEGKSRYAMAFIQFVYDGVTYEVYSAPTDGSTHLGGILSGTGETIVEGDTLED